MDKVACLKEALDKKKVAYETVDKVNGTIFYFRQLLNTRYYVFASNDPNDNEYNVHLDEELFDHNCPKEIAKRVKKIIKERELIRNMHQTTWMDILGWVTCIVLFIAIIVIFIFGTMEKYSNTADYNNIKVEIDAYDGDYIITNLDNNVVLEIPIHEVNIVEVYSTGESTSKLRIVERKTYFGSPEIHYTLYVVKEIK